MLREVAEAEVVLPRQAQKLTTVVPVTMALHNLMVSVLATLLNACSCAGAVHQLHSAPGPLVRAYHQGGGGDGGGLWH